MVFCLLLIPPLILKWANNVVTETETVHIKKLTTLGAETFAFFAFFVIFAKVFSHKIMERASLNLYILYIFNYGKDLRCDLTNKSRKFFHANTNLILNSQKFLPAKVSAPKVMLKVLYFHFWVFSVKTYNHLLF